MRWMGFVCALGMTGQALASFDMLLILDSTQNVVHRYDGDNNVYLGNFGGGTLNQVRGIDVDTASQTAYVTHDTGYSAWNYNTGEFKFYFDGIGFNNGDVFVMNTGQILFAATGGGTIAARLVNSLGVPSSFSNLTNPSLIGPFTSAVQWSNGDLYSVRASTGDFVRLSSSGSFVSNGILSFLANTSKGDMESGSYVALRPNGQALAANLATSSVVTGSIPINPLTTTVEFASAHPGVGWGIGTGTSGTRIQRYVRGFGGAATYLDAVGPGRTLPQVTTPAGLAVVVAPEPGTMAALGLGVAALVRKRRAKRASSTV